MYNYMKQNKIEEICVLCKELYSAGIKLTQWNQEDQENLTTRTMHKAVIYSVLVGFLRAFDLKLMEVNPTYPEKFPIYSPKENKIICRIDGITGNIIQ